MDDDQMVYLAPDGTVTPVVGLRDQFAMAAGQVPSGFDHGEPWPDARDFKTDGGTLNAAALNAATSAWTIRREVAWRWAFADAMMKQRGGG